MSLENRKLWTTIIPIAVGGVILASLWFINSYQHEPKKEKTASSESVPVPPNSAHEKASLEEQLKKNPGHTPILMRLAELEQQGGNPAGAVPHLKAILEKDPQNEEARLELGRSLYDAGDVEGATKETKQLIADHPNNVDGLYNLGAIYANQNLFELARQYWTKAVQVAPQSDSGRKSQEGLQKLGTAK
jgi:tetratricopeptide (TPR) repeat protein